MILKLPTKLSPETLHQAFHDAGPDTLDAWLENARLEDRVVRIDLSQTEFAELTALARLLLTAEAAVRSGATVAVDLPSAEPDDATPQKGQPSAAAAELPHSITAQRRMRCLRFLRASGFTSAISLPHLPEAAVSITGGAASLDVVHDPGPSEAVPFSSNGRGQTDAAAGSRQILPFRWVRPNSGDELFHSEDLRAIIVGLVEIGLPKRDAQLLANAVAFELVENVCLHAPDHRESPPHALVGALALEARLDKPPAALRRPELADLSSGPLDQPLCVVQLVVGDSGSGLVRTLGRHGRGLATDPDPDSWSGTPEERVVFCSLQRWSSRLDEQRQAGRGTRGLWRVRRTVRSYGGALLVHTADALAGYVFPRVEPEAPARTDPDELPRIPVAGQPIGAVPGTLVEAIILPSGAGEGGIVASPPSTGRHVDLEWVRVGRGAEADADALAKAERFVRAGRNVVLTVDGGPRHEMTHSRLVTILTEATGLAASVVVVVLVTGVDPVMLDVAVDAVHNPPPGAAVGSGHPLLLIDGTGRARWCGGSPEVHRLLDDLLGGSVPAAGPPQLGKVLGGYPQLVRQEGDSVELTVQPADVIQRLGEFATHALQDVMESDGPGVRRGRFRTPNLALIDRWFAADVIVERAVGPGLAAFLLAQRLASRHPEVLPSETTVVQISQPARDVALLFVESATVRQAMFRLPEDSATRISLEQLAPGAPSILCTDVLLSTNHAAKAVRRLLDGDAEPRALVTPLDARGHGGPIEVEGLSVPVISLAEVSGRTVDASGGEIVDIDPVFRIPEQRAQDRPAIEQWTEEEFLRECADLPGVVRLGHMDRPLGRHFGAYFNPDSIISSSSKIRERITTAMLDAVTTWLDRGTDPRAGGTSVRICHVGPRNDYAGRLTGLIVPRLSNHLNLAEPLVPVEIPREAFGESYAFPEYLEDPPTGCDVVLVDWGSFDATTILQMMRLAAEGGARRILGIILLNQMGQHDERTLTMVRAVAGGRAACDVPTEIRFLTRIGITPMSRTDCSLCELATEIRANLRDISMPLEVAKHAQDLAERLRPREREEIIRTVSDAFGSPSTTDEAFAYIRLRSQLLAARRSTSRAASVADYLVELAAGPLDLRSVAAIRLLAAERHWLGQRPLELIQCRSRIAQLADMVVREVRLDEWLRLEALVVLAAAAPYALSERLSELWPCLVPSRVLRMEGMYQLWVNVHKQLRHTPDLRARLRRVVTRCRDTDRHDYPSVEEADETHRLLTRLLHAIDRLPQQDARLTPQQAWARLRDGYLASLNGHCKAETAMINLLVFLEEMPHPSEALDDDTWTTMMTMWARVDGFLRDQVVRFTPQLQRILSGPFAEQWLTRAQHTALLRLTAPDAVNDLNVLESNLIALRDGKSDDPAFAGAWREAAESLDVWYRMVLSAGGGGVHRAVLAAFLEQCPSALVAVVQECADEARSKHEVSIEVDTAAEAMDALVFCPRDLLSTVMGWTIEAAIPPERPAGTAAARHTDRSIGVSVTVRDGRAEVRLRQPVDLAPESRRDLAGVVDLLRDFDASAGPITGLGEPATGITLTLPVWQGVGERPT